MKRHLFAAAPLLVLLALCHSPLSQATELSSGGVPTSRGPTSTPAKMKPYRLPARYRGHTITRRDVRLTAKVIALTFDDGPNPVLTPLVLKALAQYKARATFFVIGQWAQEYPGLLAQEVAGGHEVASHSYTHPNEDISIAHAARELERTQTVIEQMAGAKPKLFRPPFGNLRWSMGKVAAKQGYCVVKWTVCGSDNPSQTAAEIVDRVTLSPQPGDIVLLHDGRCHEATAKALPEILRRLSAKGYRFVTVPQLLRMWDAAQSAPANAGKHKTPTRRGRA